MRHNATHIPVDRPLTDDERSLVRWMLEHGHRDASSFLFQLAHARVIAGCPCGCASINFAFTGLDEPTGAVHVIADFLFGDEAFPCGAFVFEKNGVLAGLEVYGLTADAPRALPKPTELRSFEKTAK